MNTKGHNQIFAIILILVATITATFFLWRTKKDQPLQIQSPHPSQSSESTTSSPSRSNPSLPLAAGSSEIDEYVCVIMKHLCLDDPLTAATEIEAKWLQQFGYPSSARLEELERMSYPQLQNLSTSGDLPARIALGKRQVQQGDHIEGRATILDALINGSTYAAYELARSNNPETASSTKTDAMAYYRLAYLMGDWKASHELYRTQSADILEMRLADERAMELYRNILDERGKRRLPMRIWPRP